MYINWYPHDHLILNQYSRNYHPPLKRIYPISNSYTTANLFSGFVKVFWCDQLSQMFSLNLMQEQWTFHKEQSSTESSTICSFREGAISDTTQTLIHVSPWIVLKISTEESRYQGAPHDLWKIVPKNFI